MKKFKIHVCENYIRETEKAIELLGIHDVELTCFSGNCGNPPLQYDDLLLPEEAMVNSKHLLVGSACTKNLKDEAPGNWNLIVLDNCFKFFLNEVTIDAYVKDGAYLLTPGWLKNWRAHLLRWGFNQENARDFFKESCSHLLLLDTAIYEESDKWLAEISEYLAVEARTLPVGLEFFRLKMKEKFDSFLPAAPLADEPSKEKQEFADFAMAFDLISNLVKEKDVTGVFRAIILTLELLFAPEKVFYLKLQDNAVQQLYSGKGEELDNEGVKEELLSLAGTHRIHEHSLGFDLSLDFNLERLAVIRIEGLAFPDKMDHYLNLCLFLREVFALAISNARAFQIVIEQQQLLSLNEIALKEDAEELECNLNDLEEKNKELDAFSHMVAHDLKNPLASIIGFAKLLKKGGESLSREKIITYSQVMEERSRKMIQIIESLLLFSGVREASVKLSKISMEDIVQESLKQLEALIESSHADFTFPKNEWPSVKGYAPWVEEVWTNFISNALKYGGDSPKVELGFDSHTSETKNEIRFWVKDSGEGISEDDQKKIFDNFERLDQVNVEGTGLGLSIVQRIIERLGGHVGLESSQREEDHGSLFYFTLPLF